MDPLFMRRIAKSPDRGRLRHAWRQSLVREVETAQQTGEAGTGRSLSDSSWTMTSSQRPAPSQAATWRRQPGRMQGQAATDSDAGGNMAPSQAPTDSDAATMEEVGTSAGNHSLRTRLAALRAQARRPVQQLLRPQARSRSPRHMGHTGSGPAFCFSSNSEFLLPTIPDSHVSSFIHEAARWHAQREIDDEKSLSEVGEPDENMDEDDEDEDEEEEEDEEDEEELGQKGLGPTEIESCTSIAPAGRDAASWPSCVICLEDFSPGQTLRFLRCFHRYHKTCIDKWLSGNRCCPECKIDVIDGSVTALIEVPD